ncbi:hypothetical protein D5S17_34595 [Pseudonocardiaceae bacterium YIM PH 21723]|nr:hypothetical protein D5S17_34595 [Pseudonocardiaceae bacterium YIM PH 21723]
MRTYQRVISGLVLSGAMLSGGAAIAQASALPAAPAAVVQQVAAFEPPPDAAACTSPIRCAIDFLRNNWRSYYDEFVSVMKQGIDVVKNWWAGLHWTLRGTLESMGMGEVQDWFQEAWDYLFG